MSLLTAALGLAAVSLPVVIAQDGNYTVWSSVIVQRTGDRTPTIISSNETVLTSLGQQQAFSAGSYFRNRYINSRFNGVNGTQGSDGQGAPMPRLASTIENSQIYAIALDQQFNIATALAWLQGLYPPFEPGSSDDPGASLDPNNFVVIDNATTVGSSYVNGPLDGYQYPGLHVAGGYDPNYVYLGGQLDCPAFTQASTEYVQTAAYSVASEEFDYMYNSLATIFGDAIPDSALEYYNAYAIFDWLNFQNTHNSNISQQLANFRLNSTSQPYMMDTMRYLANEQQFAQLTNFSAINPFNGQDYLPDTQTGSISTIAGNMMAAKVVELLISAIENNPQGYNQLNALFSDFEPLMSFFALMGLPNGASGNLFTGIANFGASAVFELFSYETDTEPAFPLFDDLRVRFMFRNGTDVNDTMLAYPLFGRPLDQTDMNLNDFLNEMGNYAMSSVADWCTQCGAENLFCSAYNATSGGVHVYFDGNLYVLEDNKGLRPVVAGAIGAVVTLAVAAVLFGLIMLLTGLRFHRNKSRRQSDLGGFKGGQKMASDQDLTIPKGGAIVGASIEHSPTSPHGGHERVGSWELKQAEAGQNLAAGMRPSMEQARRTPDIGEGVKPVKPLESV